MAQHVLLTERKVDFNMLCTFSNLHPKSQISTACITYFISISYFPFEANILVTELSKAYLTTAQLLLFCQ